MSSTCQLLFILWWYDSLLLGPLSLTERLSLILWEGVEAVNWYCQLNRLKPTCGQQNIHHVQQMIEYELSWCGNSRQNHVITWKPFPHYWPLVKGIHISPMDASHKGRVVQNFDGLMLSRTKYKTNCAESCQWFEMLLHSCHCYDYHFQYQQHLLHILCSHGK